MTYHAMLTTALGALLLTPSLASAQDAPPASNRLTGSAAIGIAAVPDYEGADDHRVVPLVNGRLAIGERYIAVEGVTLRANVIGIEGFEFGPVASLTFGRDDKIKNVAVARLGKIDDAYELGAFGAISVPVNGDDRVRLAVQGVYDVSDVHGGFIVSATASYAAAIGDRALLSFDIGSSYANDDYAETYFSVSRTGSMASGLARFDARGGIKDVGASITASHRVGDRWSLVGYAGYRRLLGDFADSPVVARGGSADQLSGGIGLAFSF